MPIDRPSTRGYVLLPLVGTSPPPRGAGPRKALHNGGRAKRSPLPAAVEATTRMTYRQSDHAAPRQRVTPLSPKRLCVSGRAENESTSSRRADSAADGLRMSGRASSTPRGLPGLRRATARGEAAVSPEHCLSSASSPPMGAISTSQRRPKRLGGRFLKGRRTALSSGTSANVARRRSPRARCSSP